MIFIRLSGKTSRDNAFPNDLSITIEDNNSGQFYAGSTSGVGTSIISVISAYSVSFLLYFDKGTRIRACIFSQKASWVYDYCTMTMIELY